MSTQPLDVKIRSITSKSFVDDNPYNKKFVFAIVLNATLGSFFFGFNMGIFNNGSQFITSCLIIDDTFLFFLVSSFVPLGAGIGAIFGSSLAFKFGRRKSMLIADFLAFTGIVLEILGCNPQADLVHNSISPMGSISLFCLITGRLICGICVGLNSSVVPLYISEISPIKIRGLTGSFHQVFVTIGILISYSVGILFPQPNINPETNQLVDVSVCLDDAYKYALGFPILSIVIRSSLLRFYFKEETPKFSLWNDELDEAIKMLQRVYVGNYYSDKYAFLKREKEFERYNQKISYKDLISPRFRFRFFTGCGLATLQQLSGINAVIFYSSFIFQNQTAGFLTNRNITIIIGAIGLVSALINGWLSTKFGRRFILLVGTSLISVLMFGYSIISVEFIDVLITIIFIFALVFGVSLGPIMWLYLAEILPDKGLGVAVFVDWIFTFLITVFFNPLQNWLGAQEAFYTFSLWTFLGTIFIYYCVKETKGKSDFEIANLFYTASTISDDRSLILGNHGASIKSSFGDN